MTRYFSVTHRVIARTPVEIRSVEDPTWVLEMEPLEPYEAIGYWEEGADTRIDPPVYLELVGVFPVDFDDILEFVTTAFVISYTDRPGGVNIFPYCADPVLH